MDFQKKDWQFRDIISENELNRMEDGIEEGITKAEQAQDDLAAHTAATTGVHGATSAATPNTLVQRDPQGRIKAAAPAASDDVARKQDVDAVDSAAMKKVADSDLNMNGFSVTNINNINLSSPTILTISGDAITVTQSFHLIDTEGGASTDDLSTINGGTNGDLLFLRLVSNLRTVTIRHNVGNIHTLDGSDVVLNSITGVALFMRSGPNWMYVGIPGVKRSGDAMRGPLSMGGYRITDLAAPTNANDAARKAEVDAVQNSLSGHIGSGGSAHAVATTSQAGFMSASDKSKLNGIEAGAQVNTVTSVAGKTGAVTLSKSDVGLGSVQNYGIASQAQAQAGTDNASYMTPLRTKQAIDQFVSIETGTWTPELRFGGQNTGISYASRRGQYTRIANVVYWTFEISLSSKGSASGIATIAGLPFNKGTGFDPHAVGNASNISVPSGQWLSSYIASTYVYLTTNAGSLITSAEFANNSLLRASGFYFI